MPIPSIYSYSASKSLLQYGEELDQESGTRVMVSLILTLKLLVANLANTK